MTRAELIAALEAAPGPDRALDAAIAFEVGHQSWDDYGIVSHSPAIGHLSPHRWFEARGLTHETACKELGSTNDRNCPRYTESLDAKLPGEDIVFMYYTELGYRAFDRREPTGLGAIHQSEAIARRIAALRARDD